MRSVPFVLTILLAAGFAGCLGPNPDLDLNPADGVLDPLAAIGEGRLLPFSSFEPTIAVDSTGAVYMSIFDGRLPTAARIARSLDQGLTWEDITPTIADAATYPPNSNDPYIYVDPDTDRLFLFEMQGLFCNQLAFSDDRGETWTFAPVGCTPTQGIQDHQTLFAAKPRAGPGGVTPTPIGYDNLLYYCVNRVADSGCSMSLDSGMTWGAFRPLIYQGIHPDRLELDTPEDPKDPEQLINAADNTAGSIICGGLHAHGQSSPSGILYLPRDYCGTPHVAISKDNGFTWGLVEISSDVPSYPGNHETTVSIDEAGNVFATWLGEDKRIWFAASYDEGYTWSPAQDITPADITMTYFPVIAAGGPGRIAVAYIGTDANNTDAEASEDDEELRYTQVDHNHTWNAYLTIATGLENGTEQATWQTVQVNADDDPVARGVCGNTRCSGMGDFFEIKIDHEGRPWGAFVDVCHDDCLTGYDGDEEVGNGGALGMVGTLAAGPALRGDLQPLPPLMMAAPKDTVAQVDA